MAVDINGETLVITLESGVTNIDWIDVYSDWKLWLLEGNLGYPPAFRTSGGDTLNAFLNQGAYWFLRNDLGWRIKPPEEDITIWASGNLATEDSTLDSFLPTTGAYTTQILGLQPITQGFSAQLAEGLEYGFFDNGVAYDSINGIAGTYKDSDGNLIGTRRVPSNSIIDAEIIAINNGFSIGYLLSDLTFGDDADIIGFTMIGQGKDRTTVSIPAAANIEDCTYHDVKLTGALDGDSRAVDCLLENILYITGEVTTCRLSGTGEIVLGGGGTCHFISCYAGKPGTGIPTINCGESGQALAVRDYNGDLLLKNKTGPEEIDIDLQAGQVRLDLTTVTNGKISVWGNGKLVDDATGEHIKTGIYGNLEILNETVNQIDVEYLRKITVNKRTLIKNGDVWVLVVYDNDNITPILTKALKDFEGNEVTDLATGALATEEANSA